MNVAINEYKIRVEHLGQTESAIKKYDQKIEQLSVEIERLNDVLRKKVNEITEHKAKIGDMEY